MAKKKKKKQMQDVDHDALVAEVLGGSSEYENYLKEHKARLRRLGREASGQAWETPDDE